MSDIKIPLSNISLSLIGWPLGMWLGLQATSLLQRLMAPLFNTFLHVLAGTIVMPVLTILAVRWILTRQQEAGETGWKDQLLNMLYTIGAAILVVISVLFLGRLFSLVGAYLTPNEEVSFYFMRRFISQIGEIVTMLVPVIAALAGGGIVGGLFGKFGQTISDRIPAGTGKVINLVITPISIAAIAVLLMLGVDWFYQFNNPAITLWWPAGIGGVIGLVMAILSSPKKSLPIGIIFYGIIRTILNGTRSVEALVMAIVFVAWVGLGPFAGALALGLHTVAALAKLYSEQVESIQEGPLEAVTATGANRLQTIVFAVVPQIIPPYISFTMYRWDINVRMSTIIGFVGGGGIGFVLQQNINLLNYRAASVNMLAIAIVVATMDYISSSLRERFV
jgi:phosphonate ABC transporter permease subunit PhnE